MGRSNIAEKMARVVFSDFISDQETLPLPQPKFTLTGYREVVRDSPSVDNGSDIPEL